MQALFNPKNSEYDHEAYFHLLILNSTLSAF